MTANDIIRRALRLASVIASGETPDAADTADALDTLNALLAEWRGSGIHVPDYSVGSGGETVTLDLADRDAVAYQLALRISPEYGQEVSPEFRAVMDEAFNRLRLRYFQPGDGDFSELPGCRASFDIEAG